MFDSTCTSAGIRSSNFVSFHARVDRWKKILAEAEDVPELAKVVGFHVSATYHEWFYGVDARVAEISEALDVTYEEVWHSLSTLVDRMFLENDVRNDLGSPAVRYLLSVPSHRILEIFEGEEEDPAWADGYADDLMDEKDSSVAKAASRAAAPAAINEETHLYRHFDSEGRLLYVGITSALEHRTLTHARFSSWMGLADRSRSSVELFPSRMAAKEAEKMAIKGEGPLFNVAYNEHPDREKNLIEYLVSKGRFDLLALNVSRG